MKNIKLILLLLFTLFIFKFEAEATVLQFQTENHKDSLVIKKNKSEKSRVIYSGEKIKLWLYDKNKEVGEFKSLNQDTLILLSNGIEKMILVADIKKIKVYSGQPGKIIGALFIVAGAIGMVFGGLSLIAGILALLADDIGVIILVAVPFLLGGGFGVYKAGKRIQGKRFNLRSRWSIVTK